MVVPMFDGALLGGGLKGKPKGTPPSFFCFCGGGGGPRKKRHTYICLGCLSLRMKRTVGQVPAATIVHLPRLFGVEVSMFFVFVFPLFLCCVCMCQTTTTPKCCFLFFLVVSLKVFLCVYVCDTQMVDCFCIPYCFSCVYVPAHKETKMLVWFSCCAGNLKKRCPKRHQPWRN